jgi:hypothetical protein
MSWRKDVPHALDTQCSIHDEAGCQNPFCDGRRCGDSVASGARDRDIGIAVAAINPYHDHDGTRYGIAYQLRRTDGKG